jgi:hypothetical protein
MRPARGRDVDRRRAARRVDGEQAEGLAVGKFGAGHEEASLEASAPMNSLSLKGTGTISPKATLKVNAVLYHPPIEVIGLDRVSNFREQADQLTRAVLVSGKAHGEAIVDLAIVVVDQLLSPAGLLSIPGVQLPSV